MSEFSPLRDPVFLLTWQVHLSVVILFALLGIWAGMTRHPWYVAPTLFLGLLWLFVPLEAPEPVVVLLLTVPILALACRMARRWLEKPEEDSSADSPSRLRFSLADLLWLTLIVGMGTALVMQVWRMPWKMHWPDIALSAACFCVLGALVQLQSRQATWKRRLLLWAVLIALVFAASGLHQVLVKKDLLLFSDWEMMLSGLATLSGFLPLRDVFPVYLCTFTEFVLVLGLGLWIPLSPTERRSPARLRAMLRVAACAGFLALVVCLGSIYANILNRPRWPVEQWPEVNEREAFWALLTRHKQLNPQEQSIDQLQAGGSTAAAQNVAELFNELSELLERNNITQFDSRYDKPDLVYSNRGLTSVRDSRSMARVLTSQAEWDWVSGRRDAALQHDLLCMRLGQVFQRRGTVVDALVGVSHEGQAVHHLTEIRTELSCLEIQQIESNLAPLASSREPLDLLFARNSIYDQEAAGWRGRLTGAVLRMLGVEIRQPVIVAALAAFQRRDVKLAMLRSDLAIRCYRQTYGNWPEDLAALTPDHLTVLPVDPYSQQPLVYRIAGEDFLLYSVGSDGVDDGGRFGDARHLFTPGYDLDLETWSRPTR